MSFNKRMDRLEGELGGGKLIVRMIVGDPEAVRLFQKRMKSEREAVIGVEHFEALETETTKAFHTRMFGVARDRGEEIIMAGAETAEEPPPSPGRPDGVTLN
jgi:hypothetical protein